MSRLALGHQIIENQNMTVEDGTTTVKRSWGERIFTRPWKPLMSTREVARFVPDPDVYLIRSTNLIVAHPATAAILRREIYAYDKRTYHKQEEER